MKQPGLGIAATILVMAIALGFVSLFSFPMFAGWVGYLLLCTIPLQIVMIVTWGTMQPAFAGKAAQPVKGVLLTIFCVVLGLAIGAALIPLIGAGVTPPGPIIAHWTIICVPMMFWAAIMWGGWPFTAIIRNPIAAGFTLLVAAYIVNFALFRLFFDYGFMQGAPVYVAAQDPHGLFPAWNALVFYLSCLAAMFLLVNFDLWPVTTFPGVMRQPTLGIVWTILAIVLGGIVFYIGVVVMGTDVVAFMVRVPVPFIFGTIVVQNMLQNSLFAKYPQPTKGILNVVAVVVIGQVLSRMYGALAPTVTGPVRPGPPTFDFEIWLASALLSVTFPGLIFYAEFFKFWPLQSQPVSRQGQAT